MLSFLKHLNDPFVVAKFQRFCGVESRDPIFQDQPAKQDVDGSHCHQSSNVKPVSDNDIKSDAKTQDKRSDGEDQKRNSTKEKDPRYRRSTSSQKSNGVAINKEMNGDVPGNSETNVNDNESTNTNGKQNPNKRKRRERHLSRCMEDEKGPGYIIKYKYFHYLMLFGASLGNEVFYIVFWPLWFWNVDGYVGRRICILWGSYMYFGQVAKDLIRWPRPQSPPVVRMERLYAKEYGMPSTHAMVGAGIPFSCLLLTSYRYQYPFTAGLIICVIWCLLVCFSRIYLGMHSVLDVLAGLVYVCILMPLTFSILDPLDEFILTSPFSPILCIVVPIALCLCYPTMEKWNTTRGDTTIILAVVSGVQMSLWFSYQYGFMHRAVASPPYEIIYPDFKWMLHMIGRCLIGCPILIVARSVAKTVSFKLACYFSENDENDVMSHQHVSVELPYKFITYSSLAFTTIVITPQVFRYFGIERETFFTEL